MDPFLLGLLDLANKYTGHPVQFEFQVNTKYFCSVTMNYVPKFSQDILTFFVAIVYLKFKLKWVHCITLSKPVLCLLSSSTHSPTEPHLQGVTSHNNGFSDSSFLQSTFPVLVRAELDV